MEETDEEKKRKEEKKRRKIIENTKSIRKWVVELHSHLTTSLYAAALASNNDELIKTPTKMIRKWKKRKGSHSDAYGWLDGWFEWNGIMECLMQQRGVKKNWSIIMRNMGYDFSQDSLTFFFARKCFFEKKKIVFFNVKRIHSVTVLIL